MKTAAVIAEYNPFHKGHEYQLRRIRDDSGADFILVIMSGDFVQRGAPAVIDKYQRTKSALLGGADLVLELPAAAALGSAGDFAKTAVGILDGLGVVDELWFGSETGDLEQLQAAAAVIAGEPEPYGAVLRESLAKGYSYPAAQSRAAEAVLEKTGSRAFCPDSVLRSPNDLLATAYLASMIRSGSRIRPQVLKRRGGAYHSRNSFESGWSAESVRLELSRGRFSRAFRSLPEYSGILLQEEADRNRLLFPDDFSDMVLYKIRTADPESIAGCAGVTDDLVNRMKKNCYSCQTVSAFADALKTKNLTRTRIDRALFSVLLGIRKGDAGTAAQADRVRVLGFRPGAERLIGEAARSGRTVPVIGAKNMPEWYGTDVLASNLCEAFRSKKGGAKFHHEFTKNVVKL